VVVDDLFVSLEHGTNIWAAAALYNRRCLREGNLPPGKFATPAYSRLGGVALFWVVTKRETVSYEMKLFTNPFALQSCSLPPAFTWAYHGTAL
jgi:hypothetical protein